MRSSLLCLIAIFICGVVVLGAQEGAPPSVVTLGSVDARLQRAEARIAANDRAQSLLSQFNPPVGTVLAFAGPWPPSKTETGTDRFTETELGWMLCDGRQLSGDQFKEIRAALHSDKLPNLCGCFLRGLDRNFDGHATGRDKEPDRSLGSEQGFATAFPKNKFYTDEAGDHTHPSQHGWNQVLHYNNTGDKASVRDPDVTNGVLDCRNGETMGSAGKHGHQILGGDDETRPINIAVLWIMKVRSAPAVQR
jgi:hypothetical protein